MHPLFWALLSLLILGAHGLTGETHEREKE
jgi:hypothetical protein